jgi:hypothetical protein
MQTQEFDTKAITGTYCHFDALTECELGLERPDSKLCAKCVADAYGDIVRTTWVGKAGQRIVNELRR